MNDAIKILRGRPAISVALIGLFALLAVYPAAGGVIRHDRRPFRYLALGDYFSSSVGRLVVRDGDRYFSGSGTVIDRRWIITAAHLVEDSDSVRVELDGRDYVAEGWVTAPGWDGDVGENRDLALVRLPVPVHEDRVVPRFEGSRVVGRTVISVGHGKTGSGRVGYNPDSRFFLRGGTNRLDRERDSGVLLTDFDGPGRRWPNRIGSSRPTDLEYTAAPGDSGGALFTRQFDAWALIGVTSFLSAFDGETDGNYGDLSGYTGVASTANARWISAILAGGGLPDESRSLVAGADVSLGVVTRTAGAVGVPVPSAAALGFGALMLLGVSGRRRVA